MSVPKPDLIPTEELLGPALARALSQKGYDTLTPVQVAVLDPAFVGRDLRITSQTGSGKTLAIGFALREVVAQPLPNERGVARPRAIVVTPTRELARQVEEELGWLFAGCAVRVASVTGGASYREEGRALAQAPALIVGTPGRLLDHLKRGTIDPSAVLAIVLDEADRMLDLGFRDELEALFALLPNERRTILVSATFAREVVSLADRVQRDAAHVEGTRLGIANTDIDHVLHVVEPRQKVDALVNLLLASPDAQTLVFARTRNDVALITEELREAGFSVGSLSGEMDQSARNRVMAGYKRGAPNVLIATDVAARGIDVQNIARVIHLDVPTHADSYVHRSGRTGRAGRKGTSVLVATPSTVSAAQRMLARAGLVHRFEPIPTADEIRAVADARVIEELTRDDADDDARVDARLGALATRIVAAGSPERTIARLLLRTRHAGATEPREVQPVARRSRAPRPREGERDLRGERPAARGDRHADWVPFRVSFGEQQGADPRRLLAMLCRRGGIRGHQVGAIRVERSVSFANVAGEVADAFERAARRPDPREPRIVIRREAPDGSRAHEEAAPRGTSRPPAHRARRPAHPPSHEAAARPPRRPAQKSRRREP